MNEPEKPEPEHKGSIWSHPYLVYLILTVVLFLGLVFIAWLAITQGWVAKRDL